MQNQINVSDFDLSATLECGQAFRWHRAAEGWFVGIVGRRVMRVRQDGNRLEGDVDPCYFALDVNLSDVAASFPADDGPLRAAIEKHWGLRVMRQEPWETLASFIASSTKQIVQIRQIVELLARRFGEPIDDTHFAFPTAAAIARASLKDLRECKLGFRAEHLLAAARRVDSGELNLAALRGMGYEAALEELMKLRGVGEKIAACTLLFSCGYDQAFPIDVWIERALKRIYFPRRRMLASKQLRAFTRSHFGPYAGWAQQYLFFQERLLAKKVANGDDLLLKAVAQR
jgi:N-glycosylase/DNA lyase